MYCLHVGIARNKQRNQIPDRLNFVNPFGIRIEISGNNNSVAVKDSDNSVIINTVLSYVVHSMSRSVKDLIINCLNSNFTVEEMTEAKDALWKVAGKAVLGHNTKRTDSAKRSGRRRYVMMWLRD